MQIPPPDARRINLSLQAEIAALMNLVHGQKLYIADLEAALDVAAQKGFVPFPEVPAPQEVAVPTNNGG